VATTAVRCYHPGPTATSIRRRRSEPHSSRGPGHRPLKAEITGSNPVCGTSFRLQHLVVCAADTTASCSLYRHGWFVRSCAVPPVGPGWIGCCPRATAIPNRLPDCPQPSGWRLVLSGRCSGACREPCGSKSVVRVRSITPLMLSAVSTRIQLVQPRRLENSCMSWRHIDKRHHGRSAVLVDDHVHWLEGEFRCP
jgi:hypothetical protein